MERQDPTTMMVSPIGLVKLEELRAAKEELGMCTPTFEDIQGMLALERLGLSPWGWTIALWNLASPVFTPFWNWITGGWDRKAEENIDKWKEKIQYKRAEYGKLYAILKSGREKEEEDYNQYLQRLATEDQILRRAGFRPRYQLTEDGRIVRVGIEEVEEAQRARYEEATGVRAYESMVRGTDFREYFERIYQLAQENPEAAELAYKITEMLVDAGIVEDVYQGFRVLENISKKGGEQK